ncbi:hypothetical protein HK102_009582, partial [Quaeritorhiza haematococci]
MLRHHDEQTAQTYVAPYLEKLRSHNIHHKGSTTTSPPQDTTSTTTNDPTPETNKHHTPITLLLALSNLHKNAIIVFDQIKPFLSHPSPHVRIAAVKSVRGISLLPHIRQELARHFYFAPINSAGDRDRDVDEEEQVRTAIVKGQVEAMDRAKMEGG